LPGIGLDQILTLSVVLKVHHLRILALPILSEEAYMILVKKEPDISLPVNVLSEDMFPWLSSLS
jgi:hypothetical protein